MKIHILGILLLPVFMIMMVCGPVVFAEDVPSSWLSSTPVASGSEPDGTEGFGVTLGVESASPNTAVVPDTDVVPDATAVPDAVASADTVVSTDTAATPQVILDGVVEVDTYVNIRTGPWGKIIGRADNNGKVKILSKQGDWFQILNGTEIAFIHSYYVSAPGFPSHQGVEPPILGSDQSPGGSSGGGGGGSGGDALLGYLQQAGLTGEALRMAWAIGMAESGGDPNAFNGNSDTGDQSYGLFQINMLGDLGPSRLEQYGLSSNDELFDPAVNIRVMIAMSGNCSDWSPWSTYNRGDYEEYLGQFPGQ